MNREEAQQCYKAYKCLMHPPAQDFVERLIYTLPTAEQAATIHSCSYYCERPECIKAQRDELVQRFVEVSKEQAARREEVAAGLEEMRKLNLPVGWFSILNEVIAIIRGGQGA